MDQFSCRSILQGRSGKRSTSLVRFVPGTDIDHPEAIRLALHQTVLATMNLGPCVSIGERHESAMQYRAHRRAAHVISLVVLVTREVCTTVPSGKYQWERSKSATQRAGMSVMGQKQTSSFMSRSYGNPLTNGNHRPCGLVQDWLMRRKPSDLTWGETMPTH